MYNDTLIIVLAILVVYLIYFYLTYYGLPSIGSIFSKDEGFYANVFENDAINNATLTDNYALLTADNSILSDKLIPAQIPNAVFMDMVTAINHIISQKIIKSAESCKDMHGEAGLHDNRLTDHGNTGTTLTLQCVPDLFGLRNEIINDIYKFINNVVKKQYNIEIDPALAMHDLHRHLNLLEAVIYPIRYSKLYTVHGVQYVTENKIRQMVNTNIEAKDVLYTILTRRGIEIMNDDDNIVH